ncbi:MAG TPA: hypothetical protein VE011_03725 [Candidatus Dormibacteraeota bacterium]|nr:hypothetical protein [Candidatus Dormibacteraeota bacterium]
MPDEIEPAAETAGTPEATAEPQDAAPAAPLPAGYIHDPVTGQPRPMTFMERARHVAGQAATTAAKVSVDVGSQAAKAAADVGAKAATATATTIRDPATKARAQSALKKAKRGFTTALERIDPRILADVVVKATSLQEKANASLKERGSAYRIGQIQIGASFPPSIVFAIERVDDPERILHDSTVLLAKAVEAAQEAGGTQATIVGLDGTEVDAGALAELEDEE